MSEILQKMQQQRLDNERYNRERRAELTGYIGEDITNSLVHMKNLQEQFNMFLEGAVASADDVEELADMIKAESKKLVDNLQELSLDKRDLSNHDKYYHEDGSYKVGDN